MKKLLLFITFFCFCFIVKAQTKVDFESYTSGQAPPTSDIVVGGSTANSTLTVIDIATLSPITIGNSSSKALKVVCTNYGGYVYFKNLALATTAKTDYATIRLRYCMVTTSNSPGWNFYSSSTNTSLGTAIASPTSSIYLHATTQANVWRVVEFNLANCGTINAGKLALGFNLSSNGTYLIDDIELVPFPSSTTTPFIANDFESYSLEDNLRMNPVDNATKGSATVKADPINSSNKTVKVIQTTGGTAAYYRTNVVLPSGVNLSDYSKIAFDLQTVGTVSGKMYIAAVPQSGNGNGTTKTFVNETTNTTQGTADTWVTKVYSLTGAPSANGFMLDIGINTSTAGGSYYIDNIKLCKALSTGPTVSAASGITSSVFNANWAVLDGAESYQLDVATDNGFTNMVSGYNNLNVGNVLTYTVSGLSPNTTYYYRVRGYNPGYTSSASSIINLTTATPVSTATDNFRSATSGNWNDVSTWQSSSDNSTWINATLAPTSSAVSISILNGHTVIVADNATASSLTINVGGNITVNAGKQLTVSTTLTNNGLLNLLSTAADGTATILTPATISGSGIASVQQYLTGALNPVTGFPNGRMWYVATPVIGVKSDVFNAVADANKLWYYTESSHGYTEITDNTTDLTVGTGYVSRLGADATVNFSGTGLYTGDKTISLTYNSGNAKSGFNLIGNPYPSFLDWQQVQDWHADPYISPVNPTIWVRSFSGTAMGFDTYNASLGTGVSSNGNTVTQYIAPLQAFWVETSAPSSITLNNAMRSGQDLTAITNRLKAPAVNTTQQPMVRLQISNGTNSDESLLTFNANAKDGFDAYDSHKMLANDPLLPEIYSLAGADQLAINCMNSMVQNKEYVLGFNTVSAGTFTLKASQITNVDTGTSAYLIDKLLNTETELTSGTDYTFTSDVANTTNRFSIVFKAAGSITSLKTLGADASIQVYVGLDKRIRVNFNGDLSKTANVSVYNTVGQLMERKQIIANSTDMNPLTSGVYMIIVNTERKTITQKVVLN